MSVYVNRSVFSSTSTEDIFVEIEAGQVVLTQRRDQDDSGAEIVDTLDIIVVPEADVPKLIEALQKFKPNVQLHNNK
jgi:hypothetical protein